MLPSKICVGSKRNVPLSRIVQWFSNHLTLQVLVLFDSPERTMLPLYQIFKDPSSSVHMNELDTN